MSDVGALRAVHHILAYRGVNIVALVIRLLRDRLPLEAREFSALAQLTETLAACYE